jgi:hypothetical protein
MHGSRKLLKIFKTQIWQIFLEIVTVYEEVIVERVVSSPLGIIYVP